MSICISSSISDVSLSLSLMLLDKYGFKFKEVLSCESFVLKVCKHGSEILSDFDYDLSFSYSLDSLNGNGPINC